MKLEVKGQVYPKVWDIAYNVKKLREGRKKVNIGASTMAFPVYEVTLPDSTKREGPYLTTPHGIRLYFHPGDQYQIGYLISEIDDDPLVKKHFKNENE